MASLAPGQRIMTTAGVFGTVVAVEDDRVHVEVAPGVVIEMLALAVGQVVAQDAAASPAADEVAEVEAGVANGEDAPGAQDRSQEGNRG